MFIDIIYYHISYKYTIYPTENLISSITFYYSAFIMSTWLLGSADNYGQLPTYVMRRLISLNECTTRSSFSILLKFSYIFTVFI